MLQWNSKTTAVLMIALLLVLASLAGMFDLPDSLNFAW